MALINFVFSLVFLFDRIEDPFIGSSQTIAPSLSPDYEWVVTPHVIWLEEEGNFLLGATSDILNYGANLVDWLVQAMIGVKFDLNSPAN